MTTRAHLWALTLLAASSVSLGSASANADEVNPANIPAPARVVVGPYGAYKPWLYYKNKVGAAIQAQLTMRGEGISAFPVDERGTEYQPGFAFSPQVRVSAYFDTFKRFKWFGFRADYEQDLPTGIVTSGDVPKGAEMPNATPIAAPLRKLGFRLSIGNYFHFGAGWTTNHFGLGLLANDGASNNWVPGSARFADNRGGDRVIRGYLATGPITSLGITAAFAGDAVMGDDILLPGDKAQQAIGTISIGYGKNTGAGIFIVNRKLTAQTGGGTNATAIDFYFRHQSIGEQLTFSLEGEAALIVGKTTLGATPDIPEHDVLQFGGILRTAVRARHGGTVLDVLYASGDNNPDDNKQTAFRADPNLETGMLLFRQVLAAQTGRAFGTAGDPILVGTPSPGLERVPTRGAATNTLAIFPRFYVRPIDGLEVYGGPLLAFNVAPLYDPLNTRVAGGVVKNALGGSSGNMLGLEMDLGVRQRMLFGGTELTIGLEGGMLRTGNAFANAQGTPMGNIVGGRGIVQYRF